MDKARLESRRKDFKKNFENPRRRREDEAVQIRKQMRQEQVSQKRATLQMQLNNRPVLTIPEAVQYAMTDDPEKQMLATQEFRRLLAVDKNPPIQEVIDTGIVPQLIKFLQDDNRPLLQLEAAWTLTNIASGTQAQTKAVTDHNAIPIFVKLLSSPKEDVRDQAVWALGNIAGDCPPCRDMVLQAGALQPLLEQLRLNKKLNMMRNAAWALSNLCRGSPVPDFALVEPALDTLRDLIYHNDVEILTDATWALSYLLETTQEIQIDKIIEIGVCARLVELLLHSSASVQNPALRSVGQIIAGTHQQTAVVIQAGVLKPLLHLLSSTKVAVRKEAAWVISNIAAGTTPQIQALINHDLIEPLIRLLAEGEIEVKRECAWALSNAVIGGNHAQVEDIVRRGCIKPLCDLLVLDEVVAVIALEAIDSILSTGKELQEAQGLPENPYVTRIEEADGCSKLEELQQVQNPEIYRRVLPIMTSYFQIEMDDDFNDEDAKLGSGVGDGAPGGELGGFGVSMPQGGFHFGDAAAARPGFNSGM